MTKHTIKTREYQGEGGGTEITLRIILDPMTRSIITTDNIDVVLREPIMDLREAVEKVTK